MTDRYENIRKALAMGPTPGPWGLKELPRDMQRDGYKFSISRGGLGWWIAKITHEANGGSGVANATYIAACDPDTIRELLAERDQLAAALEAAREDARVLRRGNERLVEALREVADDLDDARIVVAQARAALEQGGRAPDGGRMTEHYELPRGDWPEFYLAEIVAQTNKRSLALAIRRELGEGYVITPGIDMLYAVRRLRKRPGGRTARLGRRK